jgi:hypothetical protein
LRRTSSYFLFTVLQMSWADPFGPEGYNGPNVGTLDAPLPGSLSGPSHDEEPDVIQHAGGVED